MNTLEHPCLQRTASSEQVISRRWARHGHNGQSRRGRSTCAPRFRYACRVVVLLFAGWCADERRVCCRQWPMRTLRRSRRRGCAHDDDTEAAAAAAAAVMLTTQQDPLPVLRPLLHRRMGRLPST